MDECLEKLRQDYEASVIKAIGWLKGLLDIAKDTVQAERNSNKTRYSVTFAIFPNMDRSIKVQVCKVWKL